MSPEQCRKSAVIRYGQFPSAAYDRLPERMKAYLAELEAIHDMGDFRNNFSVGETADAGSEAE